MRTPQPRSGWLGPCTWGALLACLRAGGVHGWARRTQHPVHCSETLPNTASFMVAAAGHLSMLHPSP